MPLRPGGVDKATMVSALDTAEKKRERRHDELFARAFSVENIFTWGKI
jgi:hypothetical protein